MNRKLAQLLLALFIGLLPSVQSAYAGEGGCADTLRVSMLTCSPSGEAIYTLFGHTGLRIRDGKGLDVVYHYGVFDFDKPYFMWRYVKGETDYELGRLPFDEFLYPYRVRGSEVKEQVLDLTREEGLRLYAALEENYRPENRVYRYNYFFDNCATRPRVKVEEAIDGVLKYDGREAIETFRGAVHRHLKGHPWAQFGIDFCLGAGADRQMEGADCYFLPEYLYEGFRDALVIPREGEFRDLVVADSVVCAAWPAAVAGAGGGDGFWTPLACSFLLLLLVAVVSIYGVIKGYVLWGIDVVLFSLAGCAGLILTFLAFFSQHPAVGSNWNMVVFHPFHLLFLPVYINNARKWRVDYYHLANALVLIVFFFCFSVLPQQVNTAVVPIALALWVRSLSYSILAFEHRWK